MSASFTNKPDFVSVSSLEIVILDKDGKKLASITMPDCVEEIKSNSFKDCKLATFS